MREADLIGNRYQLESRLGSGGMAIVYRAYDHKLERYVALKLLRRDFSHEPEARERFIQEAKAAAILSHPNIVTIYDFGDSDHQLFIAMEYVPGVDLKTLLKERGRLTIAESLDLMIQASAGIGYAHRAGLVHCDIKPQNMLVTPELQLKVVDFGIARALANIHPDEQAEVVWGSPRYFSPEQAGGNAPFPASDVYSLGVVLFETLTGQPPFSAASAEELARMHREDPPPSPRKLNPHIPPALEQIILKVLSKEASARYRNADHFCQVLTNFRQHYGQEGFSRPAAPLVEVVAPPVRRAPAPAKNPVSRPTFPVDWVTWLLVLAAFLAVAGLVPFWIWILSVTPPP